MQGANSDQVHVHDIEDEWNKKFLDLEKKYYTLLGQASHAQPQGIN